MMTLDDFFTEPATPPLHPRLREWKTRLADPGVQATLELYRPIPPLGVPQTDMNLHFSGNNGPIVDTVAWDDDLNAGLIRLGVRASSVEQEAVRFALGLRGAFRQTQREFGDSYFSGVLLELITESELTRYPPIADVLQHVSAIHPERERHYNDCREMIAQAISGRARELTGPLKYTQDEAKQILVQALARYLDEGFSVSARRRMGLL